MIPLPDTNDIPAIGTPERESQERETYGRACELIHECDGRLREALVCLRDELWGDDPQERDFPRTTRDYTRDLVDHVEQCWASEILR